MQNQRFIDSGKLKKLNRKLTKDEKALEESMGFKINAICALCGKTFQEHQMGDNECFYNPPKED